MPQIETTEPIVTKAKTRRLWLSILLLILCASAVGFYVAAHKIDGYAKRKIQTALTAAQIDSEFTLRSHGLSDWELTDGTFTYGHWQVRVERATAHLSYTKLFSAPINAMITQITAKSLEEGNKHGVFTIPEIALMTSPAENGTVTLDVVAGEITQREVHKPYFAPLKLTVSLHDLLQSSEAMQILATVGDTLGKWKLQTTLDYTNEDGSWTAKVDLDPILFESGLLQPDSLFPILRGRVSAAEGALTFGGTFHQAAGEPTIGGLATLSMNNLSATIEDFDVKGISGSLTFNSFSPLLTDGEQTISIQEIVVGLPLSEGKIPFSLIKDNQLKVGTTAWHWAGGTLRTEPMEISLDEMTVKGLKLDADKLVLQSLLSSLLKEGLTASGTLEGSLPVTFEAGKPVITGGLLQTDGGGVISYTPTSDSAMQKGTSLQTDLLLDALKNFHYEFLRLKIDSIADDKLLVQLSTRGNNPDLYDGKPIELNINLTGNLFDIARSGTETFAIPKRIQEQFAP